MTSPPSSKKVGDWNERGLLNSFTKKGITWFSAFTEYIANSCDANAETVKINIRQDVVYFGDDGSGLDRDKIKNAFDNYRENHSDDKSMGTVGIGLKLANAYISKYNHTAYIYTKTDNGPYLKVTIPWGVIYEQGLYSKQISIDIMTDGEKKIFKRNLPKSQKTPDINDSDIHGTVLQHKMDNHIVKLFTNQFNKDTTWWGDSAKKKLKNKRWDVMFAPSNINLIMENHMDGIEAELIVDKDFYNYFNKERQDYFRKAEHTILYIKETNSDITHFITENTDIKKPGYIFIDSDGRGIHKTTSEFTKTRFTKLGSLKYTVASLRNNDYFDPENPLKHNLGASASAMPLYEHQFFNPCVKDSRIDACSTNIERNQQVVNTIILEGYEHSKTDGGRGTEKKTLGIIATRDKIAYNTKSSQTNFYDDIIKIQEVKDHEIHGMDLRLLRLIRHIRQDHIEKLYTFMATKIDDKKRTVRQNKKLSQIEKCSKNTMDLVRNDIKRRHIVNILTKNPSINTAIKNYKNKKKINMALTINIERTEKQLEKRRQMAVNKIVKCIKHRRFVNNISLNIRITHYKHKIKHLENTKKIPISRR
tara:strand:+ start:105 stop:1874 length:1770 start_codon:yes stop_codon:yes gene_type:complete